MRKIIEAESRPELLIVLHSWFSAEWDGFGEFEVLRNGVLIPPPFLAVENDELIGGISFTSSPAPGKSNVELWINALFVKPEKRGLGVAADLIKASQQASSVLYALTDIPALYLNLGWSVVATDKKGTVVKNVWIT